jgi:hypothetical protein
VLRKKIFIEASPFPLFVAPRDFAPRGLLTVKGDEEGGERDLKCAKVLHGYTFFQ